MKSTAITLIKLYQVSLGVFLGGHCRFTPSCSQYSIEAINTWGVNKGIIKSLKRISQCHPWGKHGFDPINNGEK